MSDMKVVKDWITVAGLRAVILLMHGGSCHCGYVAVPSGHPAHGRSYDDMSDIDVHGGLTYDGASNKYPVESEGFPWWFGYDCAHGGDEIRGRVFPSFSGDVWRDETYCEAQCERLAAQLAALAKE